MVGDLMRYLGVVLGALAGLALAHALLTQGAGGLDLWVGMSFDGWLIVGASRILEGR
jgi:hypothetical protein